MPWQRYAEKAAAAAAQGELYAIRPLEKVTVGWVTAKPTGVSTDNPHTHTHPVLVPLQHGRLIEALRKEVAENREKLRLVETRAGEMEVQHCGLRQEQGQHREQLERLRQQLEEANARAANLGAR